MWGDVLACWQEAEVTQRWSVTRLLVPSFHSFIMSRLAMWPVAATVAAGLSSHAMPVPNSARPVLV